ncbi:MAG: DNA replication/repair protein RecF [Pseudomonadota bacterium]
MSVHLRRLSLAQFRSHARVELELDPRPVALWGPNGAGKTNILEAVSLLSPGRGLRRASAEDMARQHAGVGWKLTAEMDGHDIETAWMPGGARSLRIDGKTASQVALAALLRIIWLVPAQDRLWIEGAEGRRRFFDRITMSFFPEHASATLAYEKAMRERNRLLKDGVMDPAWYAALESQMADAAGAIVGHRQTALDRIDAAQADADTAFPAAELAISEVAEPLETPAQFVDAFAQSRPQDIAAGRTLIGPHRTDIKAVFAAKRMPAAQCSTGEQKALLISLILANARAVKAIFGAAPLVLLDEVAAHLDAERRAALFDEICALGSQAWMTGTGAELFGGLGDRAQCFEVREQDGQSRLAAVNPGP